MPAEIKIFVSRRIDLDSVRIDNPLYIPVRCGAVYDTEGSTDLPGDHTGDHISEKRASFCELTVQYWAWKNMQADYYGLCHYRRYLSFSEKTYRSNEQGLVDSLILYSRTAARFRLQDEEEMRRIIEANDLVIPTPIPVRTIQLSAQEGQGVRTVQTVRELWEYHNGLYFEKGVLKRLFELIDELAPEYSASAREYFEGGLHRGYNCYIMRQELFERLCRLQFPILEVVERELDTGGYTEQMKRTPAYLGEMLYGIFLHHVLTRETWRACERQLVFFRETEAAKNKRTFAHWYVVSALDHIGRMLAAPFFPLGSQRRERLKTVYRWLIRPLK